MRKWNLRLITVLLLLVFSQKMGLRLWMHDWFHESKTEQSSSANATEKAQFKCDCIDDFMMPLTETETFTVGVPFQHFILLFSGYKPAFSSAEKIFCSLKGPPAITA